MTSPKDKGGEHHYTCKDIHTEEDTIPPRKNWKEKFREKFGGSTSQYHYAWIEAHIDELESFISQVEQDTLESVMEYVEKIKFEDIGSIFETEEYKQAAEIGMERTKLTILSHLSTKKILPPQEK